MNHLPTWFLTGRHMVTVLKSDIWVSGVAPGPVARVLRGVPAEVVLTQVGGGGRPT